MGFNQGTLVPLFLLDEDAKEMKIIYSFFLTLLVGGDFLSAY
jgi:hypothetical protein